MQLSSALSNAEDDDSQTMTIQTMTTQTRRRTSAGGWITVSKLDSNEPGEDPPEPESQHTNH
jgi:hypothetical protein